jgi:tripeptide aminopeptidase
MTARTAAKPMSDADALKMVMEMMAIPGRPGEEAAVMDYIRTKLTKAGIKASALTTDDAHKRTPIKGQVGNPFLNSPAPPAARAACSPHT